MNTAFIIIAVALGGLFSPSHTRTEVGFELFIPVESQLVLHEDTCAYAVFPDADRIMYYVSGYGDVTCTGYYFPDTRFRNITELGNY